MTDKNELWYSAYYSLSNLLPFPHLEVSDINSDT